MRETGRAIELPERGSVGISLTVVGIVAAVAALYWGAPVFEPLAFAFFIIALAAPLMHRLQPRIGKALAMIVTLMVTIAVILLFFYIILWGLTRVAGWTVGHLADFQLLYLDLSATLQAHGIAMQSLLPPRFEPRWIVVPIAMLLEQARWVSGFALLIFVFVVLGLTELDGMARRLVRIETERPGLVISAVARDVSMKFGRYMKVRLVVSLIDAVICYLFFHLVGLEEPLAWAILVGVLNFIPFIGPLIVSIFIGLFAAAQFGSLWMVALLVGGTTSINFVLGSYIEPLMAGNVLSMSAVLVLFSVFFWAIVWGIPGAFIGVQISILILSVCRHVPSMQWIADLLSGDAAKTPSA